MNKTTELTVDLKILQIYEDLKTLEKELQPFTVYAKYPGITPSEEILSHILHSRLKLESLIKNEQLMLYAKTKYQDTLKP